MFLGVSGSAMVYFHSSTILSETGMTMYLTTNVEMAVGREHD
jgi:hypothetical protein